MTPDPQRIRELASKVGGDWPWSAEEERIIAAYLRAYADLLERTRWIPVEERLPELGEKVLVFCRAADGRTCQGVAEWTAEWWASTDDFLDEEFYGRITHWRPLPDPPVT